MKGIKRMISGLLVSSLIFTNSTITANAEDVSVSVVNNPKIDIMLTSKETSLNLDNFESDVRNALENNGIDTDNIVFQTVERNYISAESADFATAVNQWTTIGAPTWTASSSGYIWSDVKNPTMASHYEWTNTNQRWSSSYNGSCLGWWGTGLLNEDAYDTSKMTMSFNLVKAGNLNNGVMFNVTRNSDGSLNGYFFNITRHQGDGSTYQLRLWKMTNYQLDQAFTAGLNSKIWCWNASHSPQAQSSTVGGSPWNVGATTVSGKESMYTLAAWTTTATRNIKYDVSYDNGHIIIKLNGNQVVNLYDYTYTKGAYGFWGNNCEQVASMQLSDFVINTEKFKTFKDVLTQPTWRENSEHIVVNVDNALDETLTGADTMGEILSRTLADEIHFIQWGSTANKSATENFISRNDGNGLFTLGTSYENAINDTVEYIESLIEQENDSQYVVVGEDTNLIVTPSELKNNAVSSSFPTGRWLIHHDDTYFTNSEGKSSLTEVFQKDLMCNFDKPGKYEIYFDNQLVKEVYAHRKPVADFDILIDGESISLSSKSYDLDSDTDDGYGKGIKTEKWYYKEATSTDWTEGQLDTFTKNKIYIIRLDVTDEQGIASSAIKYVGTGAPVANFNLDTTTITTADKLIINDTSYDPQGNDIVSYEWTLNKNGALLTTFTSKTFPDINFNATGYGAGEYSIVLKVTNSVGTSSEAFTKSFSVETARYKNKYEHYAWGFTNNDGTNLTKDAFLLQTTYGEETYGSSFTPNATYALSVPNGFYLQSQFKTSQITGTMASFNFGTSITQPAYAMDFEFDYYPFTYTITYNLEDGIANNNPTEYNVLYGFTFSEPVKKGYDFLGWFDNDGNKLTGVNENCNANFLNTADMYSKLASRKTGNIEVTAKWQLHNYLIDTESSGSGVISNDTYVTYEQSTSIFIVPADGYDFTNLIIDGVTVSPVNHYEFVNVEKDHSISATFTMSQTRKMQLISKAYNWIDLNLN